jgi:hypothetical protein
VLSQCFITYYIGDEEVIDASPQEKWTQREEFYTAGKGPEGASVKMTIEFKCVGQGGAPVGTDDEGFMVAELDDLSLVQVDTK